MYDIARYYTATDPQDLLVRSVPLGAALAARFSDQNSTTNGPGHLVVLMKNHGFTTCADSIELATMQAVYTQIDAGVQSTAITLHAAYFGPGMRVKDEISYLTSQQATQSWIANTGTVERPWDLWVHQVESSSLYVNNLDPNQTVPAAPEYVS